MKTFIIKNTPVEFDQQQLYLDFLVLGGQKQLFQINMAEILEHIESWVLHPDEKLWRYFADLERWVTDAPRKRLNRNLRKSGFTVLTTDELFDDDKGEEIIDALEHTGKMAAQLLKILYGDPKQN